MQDKKHLLGTKPVGKLLFSLALPAVTAQVINMLYTLVDRIYIGNIAGSDGLALTGMGICLPIIILISAFAAFSSMGGAPRASIAMGEGDIETSNKIMGTSFVFLMICSAVLTTVVLIFAEPILFMFGASENTIGYAMDYMTVYAIGTVFVQIVLGMNSYITIQGFAKTSMCTICIGAALNIVLDPIFIFGFGMGIKGAAIATVISQAVSAMWVLKFLTGKKSKLRLSFKIMSLKAKYLLPILSLGLASFVMNATESVLLVSFNTQLQKYGQDIAVGAMTILTSVMQIVFLPVSGISQGAQPILSYNYGAKNKERVKSTFWLLIKVEVAFSFVYCLLVMLFPSLFVRIFTQNEALVEFAQNALRVYMAGMFFFGAQMACQITLVSLGKAGCSVIIAVVRKVVLLIPLIYILPLFLPDQTTAVYLAEPISDIIAVIFTVLLFSFQFRKAMNKMDNDFEEPAFEEAVA